MPIVLNQRAWYPDPRYLDREWVIYHYPRQYRTRITPYDRFIYYRPAKGAIAEERSTYFGHGVLGVPFDDPHRVDHSFVPIAWAERFSTLVPLQDATATFYETESSLKPQFQSSARKISETSFFRILALGGVSARSDFSPSVTTETVISGGFTLTAGMPKDTFRIADRIPEGTGYVPSGGLPDLNESAALQERARRDHQDILERIREATVRLGGRALYNNNVDLFVEIGESKYLVEAKSLNDPASAVDRMRYGMGQLFDYRVLYESELAGAQPVLAFGARPAPTVSWIGTVLQGNAVGFIASDGGRLIPLNERAQSIAFLRNV
jgi:hypothetical protein